MIWETKATMNELTTHSQLIQIRAEGSQSRKHPRRSSRDVFSTRLSDPAHRPIVQEERLTPARLRVNTDDDMDKRNECILRGSDAEHRASGLQQ